MQFVFRYLIRLPRVFITKFIYKIFLRKHLNYKPIITYLVLVSFSVFVLVYNQNDRNIFNLLPKSSLIEDEIIQVDIKEFSRFVN